MKPYPILYLLLVATISLTSAQSLPDSNMLCMGHYYTEAQADSALRVWRSTYASGHEWLRRADTLPGVYLTGSLYTPAIPHTSLARIPSTHGHTGDLKSGGRFHRETQIRNATLARMGAAVFAYEMMDYGEMAGCTNISKP